MDSQTRRLLFSFTCFVIFSFTLFSLHTYIILLIIYYTFPPSKETRQDVRRNGNSALQMLRWTCQ